MLPTSTLVVASDNVKSLPATFVTKVAVPSPLSIPDPISTALASATVIVVEPCATSDVNVGVSMIAPEPVTPVT